MTDVYHRYPISTVGDCNRVWKLKDDEDVQTKFFITAEYPNLVFVELYANMYNTQPQQHPIANLTYSDWEVMEKYLDQAMKLE